MHPKLFPSPYHDESSSRAKAKLKFLIDEFRRLDSQFAEFNKRLNSYVFGTTMRQQMDERSQKNDDNDITHKIAVDIPILDGVCDIQPKSKLKPKIDTHGKPIAQIFENLQKNHLSSLKLGAFDDHVHEDKPI